VKHQLKFLVLLFIPLLLLGSFQTTPTLKEMKALASIKGKIPGAIVWSTSRHGTWEIYKMNADGTEKVRLTHDQHTNQHPVWSRDGKWIYYERDKDIYRMQPDGTDSQLVLENGFSFDISWDGTKIVYVTQDSSGDSIRLYDCEKQKSEEIIPLRLPEFKNKELRFPTLSPDEEWLFFSSSYPKAWSVHRVKLDGTSHSFYASGCMPQYSPNGLYLAWVYGGVHHIYIGTADGSEKKVFENSIPGRPHCYFAKWSPDGNHIVFAASPSSDRRISDYEIFIKPVKGGEAVRLTFDPATDTWPDIL
jgi:Tol biopolymer transport system component